MESDADKQEIAAAAPAGPPFDISLAAADVPMELETIAPGSLNGGRKVEQFEVDEAHPAFRAIDGVLFDKSGKTLICYPQARPGIRYVLPDGVEAIAPFAFYGASKLRTVRLNGELRSIDPQAFVEMKVFRDCEIAPENSSFKIVNSGLYDAEGTLLLAYPTGLNIPFEPAEGVTAYDAITLKKIKSVSKIAVPKKVVEIETDALQDFKRLKEIEVEAGNPAFSSRGGVLFDASGETLLRYPIGASATTYATPPGVKTVGKRAFSKSALKMVRVSEGVETVMDGAFFDCANLETAYLPNSALSIGAFAFELDGALKSVKFPPNLRSIGKGAFRGCGALAELELPESVEGLSPEERGLFIESEAFSGCASVKQVALPEGLTTFGDRAFTGCSSLVDVQFPSSLTALPERAFAACSSLQALDIPDGVAELGPGVVSKCSSLKEFTVPPRVDAIPDDAFLGCASLERIAIQADKQLADLNRAEADAAQIHDEILRVIESLGVDSQINVMFYRYVYYEWDNPAVIRIDRGVITALKKGTASVYVFAQNGVFKKLTVKVS